MRNGRVRKIFCVVIFAACIGGLKWMCACVAGDATHSPCKRESLYANGKNTQDSAQPLRYAFATTHIPFQLKVKQYHLNVTTESGGVHRFQATGSRKGGVSFNSTSPSMLHSSARRTGHQTGLMHALRISMFLCGI